MGRDGGRIKVLAVAPYDGLRAALEKAAAEYPQLLLDTCTGDLEEGAELVKRGEMDGYDVILSRGGTAELIREMTDIPVVSIRCSVYDVLRAIQMAENYAKEYALVGFPTVTEPAHVLCTLLGRQLEIVTVHSAREVGAALDRLRENGCRTVVSDMAAHTGAQERGLEAFLITSGPESLRMALEEALSVSRRFRRLTEENFFLRQAAREAGDTVILDQAGEVCYSSWEKLGEGELEQLRRRMSELSPGRRTAFYQEEGSGLYQVTARVFWTGEARYYLFCRRPSPMPLNVVRPGIQVQQAAEVSRLAQWDLAPLRWEEHRLEKTLEQWSGQPVLLLGERGTGKDRMARRLYLRGGRSRESFVTVDMGQMEEKNWAFLLSHEASPLNAPEGTVYFSHLERAPEGYLAQLAQLLEGMGSKGPGLILTCQTGRGQAVPETVEALAARLGSLPVWLEPLRDRWEELPALAGRYLQQLNLELGKQLVGFEPRAMELLQKWTWPGNVPQFCRLLRELAAMTSSPYIRGEDMARVLEREGEPVLGSSAGKEEALPGPTLEEITRRAIARRVAACGGNQTAAAAALGISRTTLWRYLRRTEETGRERPCPGEKMG